MYRERKSRRRSVHDTTWNAPPRPTRGSEKSLSTPPAQLSCPRRAVKRAGARNAASYNFTSTLAGTCGLVEARRRAEDGATQFLTKGRERLAYWNHCRQFMYPLSQYCYCRTMPSRHLKPFVISYHFLIFICHSGRGNDSGQRNTHKHEHKDKTESRI